MLVKQIIASSAKLLLFDALADKITNGNALSDDEKITLNGLLRAYNLVLNEVATEYLDLLAENSVRGETINYSSLSHFPKEIISVYAPNFKPVKFLAFSSYLKLPAYGDYTVRYSYVPGEKTLTDAFDYEGAKVGERAFIYGVAAEYCTAAGRYEEASNWRTKFERAATSPLTRSRKKIKGRIWG